MHMHAVETVLKWHVMCRESSHQNHEFHVAIIPGNYTRPTPGPSSDHLTAVFDLIAGYHFRARVSFELPYSYALTAFHFNNVYNV